MNNIKLKPGTIDDYKDSMAEAMENAFKAIWPKIMHPEDPENQDLLPLINDHFRMIFIAIAQGVVQHLVKNAKAISVNLEIDGNHLHSIYYNKPEDTENNSNYLYFKHKHQEENSGSHTHLNNDTIIDQVGTLNL